MRELIGAGVDVNGEIDGGGLTPLMISRSPDMTRALLALGADPGLRDRNGMTALHHMVFADRAEKILPLILAAGADVDAAAAGANGETPLIAARQLFFEGGDPEHGARVMRILHGAGASVNARDDLGYTVLTTAAVNDKPALARLMLALGADPDVRTPDGRTALAWARELKHREIERLLLAHGAKD